MSHANLTFMDLIAVGVFWLIVCYHWSRRPCLPVPDVTLGKRGEVGELPLVSIIVPARNEEHQISRCVRSLLAQDYPEFEVIVVDDRSEDGTNAIVSRIAKKDSRLTLISGVPVPKGWMGKAHAVLQGYRCARGEWLLFTDADTEHAPFLLTGVMSLVLNKESPLCNSDFSSDSSNVRGAHRQPRRVRLHFHDGRQRQKYIESPVPPEPCKRPVRAFFTRSL